MSNPKITKVICILCTPFFLLLLSKSICTQTIPWSWPSPNPFPIFGQSIANWPQSGFFPSAGPYTSSGWPIYQPLPYYTPAPGGTPTSSTGCPVGLVRGLTIDEEFGPGASQITRCLTLRTNNKMVIQINQFEASPGRPYGLVNIQRTIDDYTITNGTRDFKIAAVVHGSGEILMLNRNAANPHPRAAENVYQPIVEDLIAKGVEFYL